MKKVGNAIYVHKSAIDTLPPEALKLVEEANTLFSLYEWRYDVLKVTDKTVSCIRCIDWDGTHEPEIEFGYCILPSKRNVIMVPGRGQVYHHKWMFVKPDYTGFDVNLEKNRSKLINDYVKRMKIDKKRIGSKRFWELCLIAMNLEP